MKAECYVVVKMSPETATDLAYKLDKLLSDYGEAYGDWEEKYEDVAKLIRVLLDPEYV